MCGILGVRRGWLARAVADPEGAVVRALSELRWRGRDDLGLCTAGDFVVGCARLAITDRRSRQPVVARSGAVGVLNGAITDARERWIDRRARFASRTRLPNDAWLPVLTAAHDPSRLSSLRGHHALAVVAPDGHSLFLARDAFGEKPLYVAREKGRVVAFASTLPALRELGVPFVLPEGARQRFFAYGFLGSVAAPPGRGIALEPTVDDGLAGGIHLGRDGDRPLPTPGDDAANLSLASALEQAVRRCADAEGPVALSLSGGVDSSCLAVLFGVLRRGASAYQFRAVGTAEGERETAHAVAQRCGLRLREVDGGPEVLDALATLTRAVGLPLGDPSVFAAYAVAIAARDDGVRVLLSGEGADETLFGYDRHRALAVLPRFRVPLCELAPWSMHRRARALRAVAARDPYAAMLQVSPPGFLRAVVRHDAPHLDDLRLDGAVPAPAGRAGAQLGGGASENSPSRSCGGAEERLRRAETVDRALYLRSDLLPKLDVATLFAQVEGRCPFLDADVQRAAAAMPRTARLGKVSLQQEFASRLPSAVFAQRKRGFSLPLDRWFRGELRLLDLLRDARTRQREHLDARGLDRAIDRHRAGRSDLGHALYLVAAYETWLRTEDERCG